MQQDMFVHPQDCTRCFTTNNVFGVDTLVMAFELCSSTSHDSYELQSLFPCKHHSLTGTITQEVAATMVTRSKEIQVYSSK